MRLLATAVLLGTASTVLGAGPVLADPGDRKDKPPDTCAVGVSSGLWRVPLQGRYRISSQFGMRRHPIHGDQRRHAGVDLASGSNPVLAASAGVVVRSGPYGGLGNSVEIRHDGGVSTVYGHLSRIGSTIAPGIRVKAGQRLGVEGSTGNSTGVHLHFEVRINRQPVDPLAFMANHGVPLDGRQHRAVVPRESTKRRLPAGEVPAYGVPRKASLVNAPAPIPRDVRALYAAAAKRYGIPWNLLAGIGMAETAHGRTTATSSAGARGLMQFMPGTWKTMGVDGNGDGRAEITNPADSVMSAGNYLRHSGVANGPNGVRRALFAYNRADWYVNDVLFYAAAYRNSGEMSDDAMCGPGTSATAALDWARSRLGDPHAMGADGPKAWDGSSFVRRAYSEVGVRLPRTAQQQRDWLAGGHGVRVQPGEEEPGDLIFYDSYRGPRAIGNVIIVVDPERQQSIAATTPERGVAYTSYRGAQSRHTIFEIWRPRTGGADVSKGPRAVSGQDSVASGRD